MSKIRWKRRREGEISSLNSKSGTLYVGTTKGDFSLLDIRTGKVIWSKNFGEPISGAHIGLNYLYIHSTGGLVAKVKKSDSKIEWIDDLDARLFSTPFTFDGEIFYSSGAKNIYGYKL
jgi:outer membrane protein assembly factor BamB